jgi:hypothetical protein
MSDTDTSEVIFSYYRDDALADGIFTDVSEAARSVGFVLPVCITTDGIGGLLSTDDDGLGYNVRLSRLLLACRAAMLAAFARGDAWGPFRFTFADAHTGETEQVCAALEQGRDGKLGINIFLPREN